MRIRGYRNKKKTPSRSRITDLRAFLDEFAVHSPDALEELRRRVSEKSGREDKAAG
jgi:hypothetical protein